mmetsp:Transcript_39479/g.95434  ORF Transcript_39479/g.95434 Transcript_39479/m.95434 type:complete len:113 (-) Transcript_39479:173-511(-)
MTFKSFREFYPFYLSEHANRWTRRFHFAGTSLGMGLLAHAIFFPAVDSGDGRGNDSNKNNELLLVPIVAYGFAWVSHFFIEKNRPATFKYPLWSFRGDLTMWSEMIQGRLWN